MLSFTIISFKLEVLTTFGLLDIPNKLVVKLGRLAFDTL